MIRVRILIWIVRGIVNIGQWNGWYILHEVKLAKGGATQRGEGDNSNDALRQNPKPPLTPRSRRRRDIPLSKTPHTQPRLWPESKPEISPAREHSWVGH